MGKRMVTPAVPELDIGVDVEATRTVLRLTGEIDAATSARLRSVLATRLETGGDVVIDLSGVRFIDSSGLGVLVGALRRFESGDRHLVLRGPTPSLRRVLEMTGLAGAFPIEH